MTHSSTPPDPRSQTARPVSLYTDVQLLELGRFTSDHTQAQCLDICRTEEIGVNRPVVPGPTYAEMRDPTLLRAELRTYASAVLAGLFQVSRQGAVNDDETVVVISTGTGLKEVPAATSVASEPIVIPPIPDAVAGTPEI